MQFRGLQVLTDVQYVGVIVNGCLITFVKLLYRFPARQTEQVGLNTSTFLRVRRLF